MFNSLTEEQLSIQRNCATIATVPSQRMRIIARAGTGKTTTMEAVVMKIKQEAGPQPLICYTAFNKTTETEFGERIRKKILAYSLPFKDIESRTLHSLCYNWFIGTRGGDFLRDMKENIDTEPVVKYFNLENIISERYDAAPVNVYTPTTNTATNRGLGRRKEQRIKYEAIWVAELILKTLENFLNSAASTITDKHLPYQITNRFKEWCDKMDMYLIKRKCMKISAVEFYGKFDFTNRAAALYKESLSHNEAAHLNVTHSVYQKHTQLSGAILTSKQGRTFNVYLVDEAQDLNECQCAIIHRQYQQGATIALVGDPAQSIYQFRGACRQFERWEVDSEETLTLSFRFGRQVARLCNLMLGMEKLWLHSLRDSITPNSLPLGLKKEIKAEESVGHTQGGTQATTQSSTQSQTPPAAPLMIQALVRGLDNVADKCVPPNAVLDYPFTVICRTNNNTYFALLECIQSAVVQTRNDTSNSVDNTNSNGSNPSTQRKRPWDVFDLTAPSSGNGQATPYTHHSAPKYGTQPIQQYGKTPGSAQSGGGQATPGLTTPGAPVQVLPNAPDALVAAPRRFYVNGVKSYAQLENNLVRRIEQLAQISLTKPYMYKGEQYTDIEALRDVSTEMEDITLRELIDITKKWGGDIQNIKQLISRHYAASPAEADVFVTTVHKSKGLEWDNVALGIDLGAPLTAQALFVIRCGGNGGDGVEKFAICLEKTRDSAFAAINHWLQVGAAPTQGGIVAPAGGVVVNTVAVGAKVKAEPGFGVSKIVTKGSSGVIDLCDDEDEVGWTCVKCAHRNADSDRSCDNCFVARHPAPVAQATHNKKVNPFALDAAAHGSEGYDTAADDSPPPPQKSSGAASGEVAPNRSNQLVPLLPSTVTLGYEMLRTPACDFGDNGGLSGSSKCSLVCLFATHSSCRARVMCMFQHEVAQRKRQHGNQNVCVIVRTGEGAVDYKLDYTNSGTNDETAEVMRRFKQEGGQVPVPSAKQQFNAQGTHNVSQIKTENAVKTENTSEVAPVPRFDPFIIKFTNRQNANEWYVAVSRAKRRLRANKELAEVLEWVERDIGGIRSVLKTVIGEQAEVMEDK